MNGAPEHALEVRQEQLSVPRRRWPIRSTRRPCSAADTGKYFLNPTGQGVQRTASAITTCSIASNDGGRTPTYALANPFPNGIQAAAGQLAGPAHVPRARSELLEPGLRRAERAPVLGRHPARAAGAHLARSDLRRQPQPRHRGELGRLQRAVGGLPGAVRRHARAAAARSATSCCRIRSSTSLVRGHDPVHQRDALARSS